MAILSSSPCLVSHRFRQPDANTDPETVRRGHRWGGSRASEPGLTAGDNPVNNSDPTGLCVSTPFGCVGPGPANGISGTLGATWKDTGGKVVSVVHKHWRGIAQVAVSTTAAIGTALTGAVCAALAPVVGCGIGALNSWIGGGGAQGIAQGCGEGGLVGSAALLCVAGFCGPVAAAWAVDLAIGGAQGDWDYSQSQGCHTVWGYVSSFFNGAYNNAPIPWDKLFGGGGDG